MSEHRLEPPHAGDELATLLGFLDYQRATPAWKVEQARAATAEALADGGLDRLAARAWPDGRTPSPRWILVHMIEEYARHNGHADLLREAVDGAVGE